MVDKNVAAPNGIEHLRNLDKDNCKDHALGLALPEQTFSLHIMSI
jgi:hypothetical protein